MQTLFLASHDLVLKLCEHRGDHVLGDVEGVLQSDHARVALQQEQLVANELIGEVCQLILLLGVDDELFLFSLARLMEALQNIGHRDHALGQAQHVVEEVFGINKKMILVQAVPAYCV